MYQTTNNPTTNSPSTNSQISGQSMLCELNWSVETPAQVFSCELCEIFSSCCILSHDAQHQNTLWPLHAMDSLFDGRYSKRGNMFLPITEAYLEPTIVGKTNVMLLQSPLSPQFNVDQWMTEVARGWIFRQGTNYH